MLLAQAILAHASIERGEKNLGSRNYCERNKKIGVWKGKIYHDEQSKRDEAGKTR